MSPGAHVSNATPIYGSARALRRPSDWIRNHMEPLRIAWVQSVKFVCQVWEMPKNQMKFRAVILVSYFSAVIASCGSNDDCSNHGECIDFRSDTFCQCDVDYVGQDCRIYIGNGTAQPGDMVYNMNICGPDGHVCLNGDCWMGDESSPVRCLCRPNFAGRYCELEATSVCEIGLNESDYAFCVNGGVCRDLVQPGGDFPGCFCSLAYAGEHCELQVEVCEDGAVCLNGGTCSTGSSSSCECRDLFAGMSCEYPATASCGNVTGAFCVNGGSCRRIIEPGSDFTGCNCLDGFEGDKCQLLSAPASFPTFSPVPGHTPAPSFAPLPNFPSFFLPTIPTAAVPTSDPATTPRPSISQLPTLENMPVEPPMNSNVADSDPPSSFPSDVPSSSPSTITPTFGPSKKPSTLRPTEQQRLADNPTSSPNSNVTSQALPTHGLSSLALLLLPLLW